MEKECSNELKSLIRKNKGKISALESELEELRGELSFLEEIGKNPPQLPEGYAIIQQAFFDKAFVVFPADKKENQIHNAKFIGTPLIWVPKKLEYEDGTWKINGGYGMFPEHAIRGFIKEPGVWIPK